MRFPSETATLALDYVIDRPIVAAIRVDPPTLMHGHPSTIDALVLAPPGDEVNVHTVDVCGLSDEIIVSVDADDCFNEPSLITRVADSVPAVWDPPDLSHLDCPDFGYVPYYPDDTGGYDTGDTGDTGPRWNVGACASVVPLRVAGDGPTGPFFGRVYAWLRVEPYTEGEYVPPSYSSVATSFTADRAPQAGGEVVLELRVAGRVDNEGFRWWIDGGELVGTGRTIVQYLDGDQQITRNTLRIPDDWHGPLRVFVVAESKDSDSVPYTADMLWEQLTLDVP